MFSPYLIWQRCEGSDQALFSSSAFCHSYSRAGTEGAQAKVMHDNVLVEEVLDEAKAKDFSMASLRVLPMVELSLEVNEGAHLTKLSLAS